ncbi:Peptidase S24/S26A/S26B, conserved region [Methylotenera versatilis 301]|uniref:Peptidase S24/S26A/S26B, conserved region n=1 Tax=Methylotenera versatilis (strain 301) TaxID=666681 RepID=D7DLA9_METV0|nr:Peptidase S24/S26A/S26B, conserved region [Methylotenera versatilis 301]
MNDFNEVQELDIQKLGQLRDYFASYRSLPSYRYMQDQLNMKSKDTISRFVSRLKLMGFLDMAPDNKLIPGKRFFERPLSNTTVQAGSFTAAYSEGGDYITIDEHLVKKPSITELIPVAGDSMRDLGILDGDTVIVEKRPLANIGDIVVAIIDDKFTIKTLGKEKDLFVLIPANPDFDIIRPREAFGIYGVVTGQFRSY